MQLAKPVLSLAEVYPSGLSRLHVAILADEGLGDNQFQEIIYYCKLILESCLLFLIFHRNTPL